MGIFVGIWWDKLDGINSPIELVILFWFVGTLRISHSVRMCASCGVLLCFFCFSCFCAFSCFVAFLLICFPAFAFPASLLFCFSAFLASLFSAFPLLVFLLLCCSACLLLWVSLFCFSAFSAFWILLFLLLCFSAFLLLCLSTSTFAFFFSHIFLLLYFLLLCFLLLFDWFSFSFASCFILNETINATLHETLNETANETLNETPKWIPQEALKKQTWTFEATKCSKYHENERFFAKWKANMAKCSKYFQNGRWPCQNAAHTMQDDRFYFQTVANTRQMVPGKKSQTKCQNLTQRNTKAILQPFWNHLPLEMAMGGTAELSSLTAVDMRKRHRWRLE